MFLKKYQFIFALTICSFLGLGLTAQTSHAVNMDQLARPNLAGPANLNVQLPDPNEVLAPRLANDGLNFHPVKKIVRWGDLACFINKSIACVDAGDITKETVLFDLSKGFLAGDEIITDAVVDGAALLVSSDRKIYKFTKKADGTIDEKILFDVTAEPNSDAIGISIVPKIKMITPFKNGVVYVLDNGTIAGTSLPTDIPALPYKKLTSLLTDGEYVLVHIAPIGIYKWKPGLSTWKPKMGTLLTRTVVKDNSTNTIYLEKLFNYKNSIFKCGAGAATCEFVANMPKKDVTTQIVIDDGKSLYINISGSTFKYSLTASNPVFSFVTTGDGKLEPFTVVNGNLLRVNTTGIQKFASGGFSGETIWSVPFKPVSLSIGGGPIGVDYAKNFYMVTDSELYIGKDQGSWKYTVTGSGFTPDPTQITTNGNISAVANHEVVDVFNIADLTENTQLKPLSSYKSDLPILHIKMDAEHLYLADVGKVLHVCPMNVSGGVQNVDDCENIDMEFMVNDIASTGAENELIVCGAPGVFRMNTATGNVTQISETRCGAVSLNDGLIYIGTESGEVYSIDEAGNKECAWIGATPVRGGMVVSGVFVYVSDSKRGVVRVGRSWLSEDNCQE